ncbi:SIR2 family protein [Priestia sp. D3YE.R1]|uniref:SIR2 family protein n=1 Tax=Priestia sp. D3YE.R1 TaxID=3400416 RepID=UPI003BA2D861
MDKKIYQYIQDITKAAKNENLVFFIGAGISRLSNYPQWSELVNKYYVNLYGQQKKNAYSSDEYLRIPQIFYDVEGEEAYDSILKEVFSVKRDTNSIHEKILAMNPIHIITTNYDDLIEKACWQRGQYLNVISSDEDVAKATSSRYLLKVHGDFSKGYKGKHVVLKESDYMNYEQNFPLISNLMKTLMATHTIVFIGYSLGDYNINSLLNWVKQLQKDGYNKPFFIRGDHKPIEEKTAVYYENRGLRIIDTAKLVKSSEYEYMKRYETFMNTLIESKDNALLSTDEDVIEYIYQKINPLFSLQRVRKLDLKYVFEYDYHFEVNGKIARNQNKGFDYMERFFNLKKKDIDYLNKDLKQKFKKISSFFEHNGIVGMLDDEGTEVIHNSFKITNLAYHSNYDEMEKIVQTSSNNLEESYQKAFYLAYLGRWEEAYNIYSNLLLNSITESNWWIHYLSQINRYRLYQSITQKARQLEGQGILVYGKIYRPFSEEFLERIEREMKNFNINDVFGGMPYEFQAKYRILEFLSDNKFLYDDTVKLFELTNKVRSQMSKGSYSFGLTAEYDVLLRLNENLSFLYDNSLWSATFYEFNQYIKNSLMLLFEKADYDQTRDIDELGVFMGLEQSSIYFDYYDFINVAKSFSIDDIKYIERSCDISRFEFRDLGNIEKYLIRIADELIKHFSNNGMNVVFYHQFIPEAKKAFYFAKYIKLSEESFIKIIRTILCYFPKLDANIGDRYLWIDRLTWSSGLPKAAILVIEEFLSTQANKHLDNNFSEESSNNLYSKNFANLILHFENNFVSNSLSNYALDLTGGTDNQVNYIYSLSKILSSEAKTHLLSIKKIEDISDLINAIEVNAVENLSDYQGLINDYMDRRMAAIHEKQIKAINSNYENDYQVILGRCFFLGKLTDTRMRDYVGFIDEYDFFVSPESFDYKKFKPVWLKRYNEGLLQRIAQNQYMQPRIIEILKERIKNTNDKKYLHIFMKYFL